MEQTTYSSDQPVLNAANYSLVIIKPDAMKDERWGEIMMAMAVWRVRPMLMQTLLMTDDNINEHYAEHIGKDFFPKLSEFMKSGPSIVMLCHGDWDVARQLALHIRRKYNVSNPANLIHASDSVESVFREGNVWFPGVFK